MFQNISPRSWFTVLAILLAEIVLSEPQGYNYHTNQQRNYYAQKAAQAQRIHAQQVEVQNRYSQQSHRTMARRPNKISKADSDNAKFLGSQNQDYDESEKKLKKSGKKLFGTGYGPGYGNGCFFRSAGQPEGRVLWDLNVYNVNPYGGCAGVGGFGGGYPADFTSGFPGSFGGGYPGGLADPINGGRPVRGFFQNWLGLFLPGGALSGVNRPGGGSQADSTGNTGNAGSNGPNFMFYDSLEMPVVTPNQLVSGVASTLNNVFLQLGSNSYG